jgi:DNA-binding PucR family transcriptional regulator
VSNAAVAAAALHYDAQMTPTRREVPGVTAGDLVAIAAPLQLYPGWLPAEPRAIAGDCVIHDVGEPVPDHPGGVLLLVGAQPGNPATVASLAEAGLRGYACVVVKARGDDLGEVVAAAEAAGVAVLVAPDETPWRDVDSLVSAVVDAQQSATPAYAQVRPGDLFALANAIAYSVGGATSIEDHNGRMFAYSNLPHQKIDDIRLQSITDRQTPTREGDAENYLQVRNATKPLHFKSMESQHASRLAISVRAGGELLGMIWVLDGDPPLRKGAAQALEDAGTVAALHLLQIRQQENGRRWNRGEVLASLLSARIGPGVASALIGLPTATPTTVLAISADSSDESAALGLARTIDMINLYCEAWHPRALATSVDELIYAVLPGAKVTPRGRSLAAFAQDVSDTVRRTTGVNLRIGIGPTVPTLDGVVESRRLADSTLAALRHDDEQGSVATVEDLRSKVVLGELATRGLLDLDLPGDPLAAVLEHDRERNTNYAESLLAYLDAFGDTAGAAKALCVHENTLRYRIRRLQEVFDLDLNDPDVRLVAWLQLRLAKG